MITVNWHSIRPLHGSQNAGFEELCAQLARFETPSNAKSHGPAILTPESRAIVSCRMEMNGAGKPSISLRLALHNGRKSTAPSKLHSANIPTLHVTTFAFLWTAPMPAFLVRLQRWITGTNAFRNGRYGLSNAICKLNSCGGGPRSWWKGSPYPSRSGDCTTGLAIMVSIKTGSMDAWMKPSTLLAPGITLSITSSLASPNPSKISRALLTHSIA